MCTGRSSRRCRTWSSRAAGRRASSSPRPGDDDSLELVMERLDGDIRQEELPTSKPKRASAFCLFTWVESSTASSYLKPRPGAVPLEVGGADDVFDRDVPLVHGVGDGLPADIDEDADDIVGGRRAHGPVVGIEEEDAGRWLDQGVSSEDDVVEVGSPGRRRPGPGCLIDRDHGAPVGESLSTRGEPMLVSSIVTMKVPALSPCSTTVSERTRRGPYSVAGETSWKEPEAFV